MKKKILFWRSAITGRQSLQNHHVYGILSIEQSNISNRKEWMKMKEKLKEVHYAKSR